MEYIVRKLELREPIELVEGKESADGTTALYEYRSLVRKNDLEPAPEEHLAEGRVTGKIPAAKYLFTQGTGAVPENVLRGAAEQVWTESLWLGLEFKNDRILVRILSEDGKMAHQIFREINT